MEQLNKGDRVRYNDCFYEVVAVVMSTVYLRATDCIDGDVYCGIQELSTDYKIEILD